jgi:hypothetical protein
MHALLPQGAMACQSSEWMIKNTKSTGPLHLTTSHHARRNSSPLSVMIGSSFLNMMMYRTWLPVSSIPRAFLITAVDVPSNLWNQTISGTWPNTSGSSFAILYTSSRISGSLWHASSGQKSLAMNSVDSLRKWDHRSRADSALLSTGNMVVACLRRPK